MPDTTDVKQGKDFMIIVRKIFTIALCVAILSSLGCSDEFVDSEIPPATFSDIFVNLDLHQELSFDGGYILLDEGVRGIILYRVNGSTYNAFERNCSYLPYEASSTVEVHSTNFSLHDPSCKSSFSLQDGRPTGGPARLPLRRYTISRNGRSLTITDEPML